MNSPSSNLNWIVQVLLVVASGGRNRGTMLVRFAGGAPFVAEYSLMAVMSGALRPARS